MAPVQRPINRNVRLYIGLSFWLALALVQT